MVTFATGSTTQTVSVTILNDALAEGAETFTVALGTLPSGVTMGDTTSVTVTITDDDAPTVSFTTGTVSVAEGDGTVEISVQLSVAAPAMLSIPVSATAGTATAGADYTALAADAMVTFATGSTTQTVSVTILNDALVEGAETFTVALGMLPSGVTMGDTTSVTVTITDDDAPTVSFAMGTVSAAEGDGTVDISVQLSGSPASTVAIPVMTTNGTATDGQDYTALSGAMVMFASGATDAALSQTVSVAILNDSRQENAETFTVSLGALPPGVASGTPNSVTVTITDDDMPTVSFASGTAQVGEASGPLVVTVQLNASPQNQIVVPVMTGDGTATAGSDYTALSGATVTFAAAATGAALMQTVSVAITDDDAMEGNETFILSFGDLPTGVTAGTPNSVTVTLVDDDVPVVSFTGADTQSVSEAAGTVSLTVALSRALTTPLTIPVMTANGTAIAGSDYTALSGGSAMVTFAADATGADLMQTVSVTIADDSADENDETFTVSLGTLPSTVSGSGTVTVTIEDNDTPTVTFTGAATRSVAEAVGTVELTIELDSAPVTDISIPVMTNTGTATVGQDYSNVSRDVVFAAGATGAALTQTVSVPVLNDTADENDETFTIGFGTLPPGVEAGALLLVTVTITDDDVPTLSVAASPATITEGAASTITITATVAPVTDLTVPFAVTGTDITTADYTLAGSALTGTEVTLAANTTSVALTLTAINDADPAETLTFALTPPVFAAGYAISGTSTAEITIDPRLDLTVQFAESEYAIGETSAVIEVVVEATGTTANPVTIPIMTADDTAMAGDDYAALTTTVTFPAGAAGSDLRQTLTVNLIDDTLIEGPEQFLLSFGTLPVGVAASGNSTATIRLLDDDGGNVGFVSDTGIATISEDGGRLDLIVQVVALIGEELEVTYMVMDGGSATSGDDYMLATGTLTFAAGVIGDDLMQTVSVPIIDDDDEEGNETFTVVLSNPQLGGAATTEIVLGGTGLAASVVVTIIDNEGSKPTLSVTTDRVSAIEGDTFPITLTASTAPADNLTIAFAVSGTGITTDDYTLTDMTPTLLTDEVTFPAGETSMVLLLAVEADADTAVEILTLTLDAVAADADYTVSPTNAVTVAISPREGGAALPAVYVTAGAIAIDERARTRITINAVPAPATALTIPFIIGGAGITSSDYALTTLAGTPITTGQVTLPVGALSVPLILTAVDDADATAQTLSFLLTAPVAGAGYTLSTVNEAQVTINPTTSPLTVKIQQGRRIDQGNLSLPILRTNTIAFNVVLSDLPRRTIEIPVMTGGGTATAGADYTAVSTTLTFAGSTLRQRVIIELADDDIYEGNETFMVVFGALPSGVTAGTPASVTVTIDDDEAPELVSISAAHSLIGSGRPGTTIHITASFVPPSDLQIPLSITTGGGMLGRDFTLTEVTMAGGSRPVISSESTVTLPAGETSRAFRMEIIPTRPDSDFFSGEAVTFRLRDGTGYTVSPTNSVTNVTINNLRYVEFTDDAISVDEDAGTVTVGITSGGRHGQVDESIVFNIPIVITGGTATDADYSPSSRFIVRLATRVTAGNITIPITDDDLYENDETLILAFGDLSEIGLKVGSVPGATVTITDDDALSISFAAATLTLPEDAGTVNVEMRLNGASAVPVTFRIAATPGTPAATLGTDYSIPNTSVTFAPLATTATWALAVTDDRLVEGNELFELSVENLSPSARVTTPAAAVITIADNDVAPVAQFAASNVEVAENVSGGMVAVTVELSIPAAGSISIPIMTCRRHAGRRERSWRQRARITRLTTTDIVIANGATTGTAMIPILNDDTYEADEAFTVSFGTLPAGVSAGARNRANVVILDDEALTITGFSAATMSVEENAGTLVVTVEFGSALPAPLDIKYTWSAGTATLVDDFLPDHLQQSILVDAGATNFTLRAAIIDDGDAEDGETIFINLVSAPRVRITNDAVTITINDDDSLSAGMVGFTTSAVNVPENAGMVEVTLRLGTAAASEIVIPVATTNGTATASEDYTALSGAETMVTFASGEMSQTLSIPITNDIVLENDETFTVSLGSLPSGITAGARNSVTVTIINALPVVQTGGPHRRCDAE